MFVVPLQSKSSNANRQILTRKSSGSSSSSTDSGAKTGYSKITFNSVPMTRHDEHSIKSVRDKIALFSSGSKNSIHVHASTEDVARASGAASNGLGSLTRAYTHGDVRNIGSNKRQHHYANATSASYHRSMTNVNHQHLVKGSTTGDLINNGARKFNTVNGRSQSLLEIGNVGSGGFKNYNNTLPKNGPIGSNAIPENSGSPNLNSLEADVGEARQISLDGSRISLTTPPWKQGSSPNSSANNSAKYSPAFKRKPFTVYSTGNKAPVTSTNSNNATRPSATQSSHSKASLRRTSPTSIESGSDNDSAVSVGRSSGSPSTSPCDNLLSSPAATIPAGKMVTSTPTNAAREQQASRVLKKNSVEAINRRNVLESCKKSSGSNLTSGFPVKKKTSIGEFRAIEAATIAESGNGSPPSSNNVSASPYHQTRCAGPPAMASLGKPASRSSSFTIAERKKSFESISSRLSSDGRRGSHSSQDSLMASTGNGHRRTSTDNMDSRRSSRDTIGEEEEHNSIIMVSSRRSSRSEADGGSRVATPTKAATPSLPISLPEETSPGSQPRSIERSNNTTPTYSEEGAIRKVSRTSSFASERSVQSNVSSVSSQYKERKSISNSSEEPSRIKSSSPVASTTATVAAVPTSTATTSSSRDHDAKWSTLEKKYGAGASAKSKTSGINVGDAKNKIAQFDKPGGHERPKDIAISKRSSATSLTSPAPRTPNNSLVISPGANHGIKKLTERFESTKSQTSTSTVASSSSSYMTSSSVLTSTRKDSVISTASTVTLEDNTATESTTNPFERGMSATFRLGDSAGNFVSASWLEESNAAGQPPLFMPEESAEWESFDPAEVVGPSAGKKDPFMAHSVIQGTSKLTDRKFSVPIYHVGGESTGVVSPVKLREKKDPNAAPSRPSSLIENSALNQEIKVFEIGLLGNNASNHSALMSSSGSSQADLLETKSTSSVLMEAYNATQSQGCSSVGSKDESDPSGNRRCVSVNDIRRAFEKAEASLAHSMSRCSKSSNSSVNGGVAPCHNRMSSLDSTTSDESSIPTPHYYGSVSSLLSGQTNLKDHYGSITSLASSTSLISPQVCVLSPSPG